MTEAALPKGEYIATLESIRLDAERHDPDEVACELEFIIREGRHAGRLFRLRPDGGVMLQSLRLGMLIYSQGTNIWSTNADAGPEEELAEYLGRPYRVTIWALNGDPVPLATVWHASAADERELALGKPASRRLLGGFDALPGNSLAKITQAGLVHEDDKERLWLCLIVFKDRKKVNSLHWNIWVSHPDAEYQYENRRLLQRIGSAAGLSEFDDADDLLNIVFAMTIWREGDPLIVTCREATETESTAFETAVSNKWLWACERSWLYDGGGNAA